MARSLGGWIHSFAVTDTQTHKKGYTIYKIHSIIFPRSIPEALTCITVWRRFHEIKKLHRELTKRHKALHLNGSPPPTPTDCSFFKRFDEDVIQRRRVYILELLDYTAQHPALYKCHAFSQFFNDIGNEESPLHRLPQNERAINEKDKSKGAADALVLSSTEGAIAEICDRLDLQYDPTAESLLDPERDKSEISDNKIKKNEFHCDMDTKTGNEGAGADQNKLQPIDIVKRIETKKTHKDYSSFLTPMASIESDDSDYIYEAALEFSRAVQAEANLEYKEAHDRYKIGVEILLNGSKEDGNDERKFVAKAKISKYLARAEDIYDKFLRNEGTQNGASGKCNFQLSIDLTDSSEYGVVNIYLERPWNNLAKYKVMRILGDKVMLVQSITEPQRPTYVMKGIEKPSGNSPTQTIFLPQNVPYTIDLLAFFQSEQKIFLLLRNAEGGRLYDYIEKYSQTVIKKSTNIAEVFPEVEGNVEKKSKLESQKQNSEIHDKNKESIDLLHKSNEELEAAIQPSDSMEFKEIVRSSQQLLKSVSKALYNFKNNDEDGGDNNDSLPKITAPDTINAVPIKATLNDVVAEIPIEIAYPANNIPEASLKQWARELAIAVHSFHKKGVILGDLHNNNLLLGNKGQLLLTYFYQNEGLASDTHVHKAMSPYALDGHYVAPERPLTIKSDWWSYGVILYELLIGLRFNATHPGYLDYYFCVQYPENLDISDDARSLLDNLLQQQPEKRFDFEQIQSHSFFMGTNWEEVLQNGLKMVNNFSTTASTPTAKSTYTY